MKGYNRLHISASMEAYTDTECMVMGTPTPIYIYFRNYKWKLTWILFICGANHAPL